jgi:hypothetical protein
MKSKLFATAAAFALSAGAIMATAAPASAQRWHGNGFWPGAVAAGIVGGAVAAATSPLWAPGYYDYNPGYYGSYGDGYASGPYANGYAYGGYGNEGYANGYAYGGYGNEGYGPPAVAAPGPMVAQSAPGGGSVGYCQARFHSYDPASGTYLGFDGQRHPCP